MGWGEPEQAEAWAKVISEEYARKAGPLFDPVLTAGLHGMLRQVLLSLLHISVDPRRWHIDIDMPGNAQDYPNPKIREWERQLGLPPGPRIVSVAPGAMQVTMSEPAQR